jgi:HlyD family secretion protein
MTIDRKSLDDLRIDRRNEDAPSRWSRWIAIAIVSVVLLGIILYAAARPGTPRVEVALAQAVRSGGDGGTVLNANGYVTARRQATVSSQVTGRVTSVRVEEGMIVEEGQILATIDPATPEATLRLAEAQQRAAETAFRETQVRIAEARLELERAERLARAEIASQQDLDRARAAVDALEARLEVQRDDFAVARRQVALRERGVEETIIRAPFGGVVVSKNAQEGEMISPMSAGGGFTRTGICTIVDMESLEIEVDVNEAYINRVSAGQPVVAVLDAYPDLEIPAHVIAVIPAADRQKATVRVRIGIDTPDPRILPDMGVKVRFIAPAEETGAAATSVRLPRQALRRDGDRDVVFVVIEGRLERRAVNVASAQGDTVTLRSGVTTGERVVTVADAELSDGMRVQVQEGEK